MKFAVLAERSSRHRPWYPVIGPGVLDLQGTLAAMQAEDSPIERVPTSASRIVLAASFIHPDPSLPLGGLLELRDADDRVADVADARRLTLEVTGGSLSKAATRLAPGLYDFQVTAAEGSGGQTLGLRLTFDGAPLTWRNVPIGVDRWLAEGDPLARGGCSLATSPRPGLWPAALLLAAGQLRRRRRQTRYIATR